MWKETIRGTSSWSTLLPSVLVSGQDSAVLAELTPQDRVVRGGGSHPSCPRLPWFGSKRPESSQAKLGVALQTALEPRGLAGLAEM